jgi:glycosyltransferase involved in cell wall biosynthesis
MEVAERGDMTGKPRVSVVTPFLNAEPFIQEAVEGVLAQTYEHWELLLVDDGSTDRSSHLAREYADRYPKSIRYLEHPGHQNRGASASRNLGILESRGEYIAFLDVDDVWLPRKLAEQVALLDGTPEAAMVYGRSHYWWSWTGDPEDAQRDRTPALGIAPGTLVRPPELLVRALDASARTPCPSNVLVRAEAVARIGRFEEQFRGPYQLFEDQVFLAKLYLTAPVLVTDECWTKYRQHPDSCVAVVKKTGQKHAAGLYYLRWLAAYLSDRHITDPAIWAALRRKRWRYRQPRLFELADRGRRRVRQLKRRWLRSS